MVADTSTNTAENGTEKTANAGQAADRDKSTASALTQAEVDRIVSERIARERAKFADYDELKERSTRLDEIEQAAKTDLEKATEKAAALEAELDKFKTERQIAEWRGQVAQESGVPASVLRGATLEELQAHAESLKPLLTPPADTANSSHDKSSPKPLTLPDGTMTVDQMIAAAEKAGETATVKELKAMKALGG